MTRRCRKLPDGECTADQLKARTLRASLIELRKMKQVQLPTMDELMNLFIPCSRQNYSPWPSSVHGAFRLKGFACCSHVASMI